jgi:hypothetical protein
MARGLQGSRRRVRQQSKKLLYHFDCNWWGERPRESRIRLIVRLAGTLALPNQYICQISLHVSVISPKIKNFDLVSGIKEPLFVEKP